MKVIPNINKFTLISGEKSVILQINESFEVEYILTENSNNDILQDLVEAKAYATALLYLNENYKLNINGNLKEDKLENYYNDCNELLKENVEIVEEKGILLTSINGYNIYESENGILRGNGVKKLKESFDEENAYYIALDKELSELLASNPTDQEVADFVDGLAYIDNISNEQYNKLYNKVQDFFKDTSPLAESTEELSPEIKEGIKQFIIDSFNSEVYKKFGFGLRKPDTTEAWMFNIYNRITGNLPTYETLSKMKQYYAEIYNDVVSTNNLKESVEVDLEQLAKDLVDFGEEYDYYDFVDNYDSREEAYEEAMKSFNSKAQIEDIITFIQNVIDDSESDNHDREESLIERLKSIIPTLNEEEGTQVGDIASKVDQDMNGKKKNKKYYDILLSGIDESMDSILNKGFMKNIDGQYERDGYILIKENNKFIAVKKDKILN